MSNISGSERNGQGERETRNISDRDDRGRGALEGGGRVTRRGSHRRDKTNHDEIPVVLYTYCCRDSVHVRPARGYQIGRENTNEKMMLLFTGSSWNTGRTVYD